MNHHTELPLERIELTDSDYAGICPRCGKHDRIVIIGPVHWVVCDRHRLKWCPGENLPMFTRDGETETEWRLNARSLKHHTEVLFGDGRTRPDLPFEVGWAVNAVLDRLWAETAECYSDTPSEKKDWHLFRHLYVLDRWLNGMPHELPPRWTPNFLEHD